MMTCQLAVGTALPGSTARIQVSVPFKSCGPVAARACRVARDGARDPPPRAKSARPQAPLHWPLSDSTPGPESSWTHSNLPRAASADPSRRIPDIMVYAATSGWAAAWPRPYPAPPGSGPPGCRRVTGPGGRAHPPRRSPPYGEPLSLSADGGGLRRPRARPASHRGAARLFPPGVAEPSAGPQLVRPNDPA